MDATEYQLRSEIAALRKRISDLEEVIENLEDKVKSYVLEMRDDGHLVMTEIKKDKLT